MSCTKRLWMKSNEYEQTKAWLKANQVSSDKTALIPCHKVNCKEILLWAIV